MSLGILWYWKRNERVKASIVFKENRASEEELNLYSVSAGSKLPLLLHNSFVQRWLLQVCELTRKELIGPENSYSWLARLFPTRFSYNGRWLPVTIVTWNRHGHTQRTENSDKTHSRYIVANTSKWRHTFREDISVNHEFSQKAKEG